MIKYSIIIPVRNGIGRIENCVESLLSLNYSADRFEILIVDNGSEDGTRELIAGRFHQVKLLSQNACVSSYSARNLGANHASGEWLLFSDDDCVVDRKILREYDAYLNAHETMVVAGSVRFRFEDSKNPYEIYDSKRWLQQKQFVVQRNFGCTANLLVQRGCFFKAGGFPEEFRSGGDEMFGRRLTEMGVRVSYTDGAFVYHPTRKSLKELLSKAYRIGDGRRQAFDRFRLRSFRQGGFKMLVPRHLRVWKMKVAVRGDLLLYMKLLWIDWWVNAEIRAGFLKGV